MSNCVLISPEEYRQLLQDQREARKLQRNNEALTAKNEDLLEKIKQLEKERPGLKVTVIARANTTTDMWHLADPPYIHEFTHYIGSDNGVVPAYDLKATIEDITQQVKEYVTKCFKEYIDTVYQEKVDKYKAELHKERVTIKELRDKIAVHNKKCWFKRNKIEL